MELDIKGAAAFEPVREPKQRQSKEQPQQKAEETKPDNEAAKLQLKQIIEEQRIKSLASDKNVDAPRYLREILQFTEFFNKKLKFNIDKQSDQVIVKVVDSETDKVIKEIPPEELRRMYERIRKYVGLIIDEKI